MQHCRCCQRCDKVDFSEKHGHTSQFSKPQNDAAGPASKSVVYNLPSASCSHTTIVVDPMASVPLAPPPRPLRSPRHAPEIKIGELVYPCIECHFQVFKLPLPSLLYHSFPTFRTSYHIRSCTTRLNCPGDQEAKRYYIRIVMESASRTTSAVSITSPGPVSLPAVVSTPVVKGLKPKSSLDAYSWFWSWTFGSH